MKLIKKLLPVASAAAIVAAGMVTPIAAQAETSASMAFSNMYLWRGQNLSPNGSVISGSFDYSNPNGMYAGIWMSSETGGHETDLYVGYSGEAGKINYDVSYWHYLYPEDGGPGTSLTDSDISELVGSIGFEQITFKLHVGLDTDIVGDDDYWILDRCTVKRKNIENYSVPFGIGEFYRDWFVQKQLQAIYPYDVIGGNVIILSGNKI